jgi:hypothetical protein
MKNIEIIFSILFAAMVLTIAAPNVMASHHTTKSSDPTTTTSGDKKGTTDTGGQTPDTTQGQTGTTGQTTPDTTGGQTPTGDQGSPGQNPEGGPTTTGCQPNESCTQPGPTPQATPPPPPGPTFKGPTQIQGCTATGIVALNDCTQIMNIKNVHSTTVKGSNLVVGTPSTTSTGATPVILFMQGVGYVEVTGLQNMGEGQATITYVVLVPVK